jgi:hypothetical protein
MVQGKDNSTISIPAEFYGMEVEVLVYPSCSAKTEKNGGGAEDLFARHLYSFEGYKFDRNEANDTEETNA